MIATPPAHTQRMPLRRIPSPAAAECASPLSRSHATAFPLPAASTTADDARAGTRYVQKIRSSILPAIATPIRRGEARQMRSLSAGTLPAPKRRHGPCADVSGRHGKKPRARQPSSALSYDATPVCNAGTPLTNAEASDGAQAMRVRGDAFAAQRRTIVYNQRADAAVRRSARH